MDDGRNWSYPAPTPLVHPDAPPMLFKLSDALLRPSTTTGTTTSTTPAPTAPSRS